jgi:hypothetical protein
MSPTALVEELIRRGVSIRVSETDLFVHGPVDEDLMLLLRGSKDELIRHLTTCGTFSCNHCQRLSFAEPTTCYWCRKSEKVKHEA